MAATDPTGTRLDASFAGRGSTERRPKRHGSVPEFRLTETAAISRAG